MARTAYAGSPSMSKGGGGTSRTSDSWSGPATPGLSRDTWNEGFIWYSAGTLSPVTTLVQCPQDFEWPHKPRAQLPAGQVEGQVEGREPRCAVAVCASPLTPPGPLKVHMSGVPCLLRVPKPIVHRRSLDLALMPRCQNRLVPQYALEGGEVSGWAISGQGVNAAHSPGRSWQ